MANLQQTSIDVIKQNQAPSGAFIACPDFPPYRYSWLRDGSFIAYAMDRTGEHEAARRFYRWVNALILRQRDRITTLVEKIGNGCPLSAGDFLPARYRADGTECGDAWPNFQLDGYGTWLWGLAEHLVRTGESGLLEEMRAGIDMTIEYLRFCWQLPNYDCWEEHGNQMHTSTLICLAGGLAHIGAAAHLPPASRLAEEIRAFLLRYGVADGRLTKFCFGPAQKRVELADPRVNSPAAVGRAVDASLLWAAVPFGVIAPLHPVMRRTVAEIERTLAVGGGVRRYARDTYYGGGLWVLLSAWLGWYYSQVGRYVEARACLAWVEAQADEAGRLPEQVSASLVDQSCLQPWVEKWGPMAKPLLWSHAMYLCLRAELDKSRRDSGEAGCI